jgi:hypothetical protein
MYGHDHRDDPAGLLQQFDREVMFNEGQHVRAKTEYHDRVRRLVNPSDRHQIKRTFTRPVRFGVTINGETEWRDETIQFLHLEGSHYDLPTAAYWYDED